MSYATLQDLIDRAGLDEIVQNSDRDGDGAPDASVVSAAIETARQTIDGYLAGRYRLPLDPIPEMAKAWAVSLARYTLFRYDPPEYVIRDQAGTMAQLRDASSGKLTVPGADGIAPQRSAEGAAIAEGSPPVFTDDNLRGWM